MIADRFLKKADENKLQKISNEFDEGFLECEKLWIFVLLMFVGGFFGAYTYSIRGGVFCNAQTANFVLLGMSAGKGEWFQAVYYLIPMSAYFLGTVISEAVAGPIKKLRIIRWDTLLIIIEIIAVVILGFLPETAPYQICQITISFICSMQYNTFRQAQKIPMATTFCTNHVRQVGVAAVKFIKHRDDQSMFRLLSHLFMLCAFALGAAVSACLCGIFLGKAIWAALIPLAVILIHLMYADLKKERDTFDRIPHGH